jgi:hypothetical protein
VLSDSSSALPPLRLTPRGEQLNISPRTDHPEAITHTSEASPCWSWGFAERNRDRLARPHRLQKSTELSCEPPSGNVNRAPYGASQHTPIDERDIAAVAVEALLTDRLPGQIRCR